MTTYTYVSFWPYTLRMLIGPNAKCQRVLELTLWLVVIVCLLVAYFTGSQLGLGLQCLPSFFLTCYNTKYHDNITIYIVDIYH